VIAQNTEQQCGFAFAFPPPKNCILSPGVNLPPVWEPLTYIRHFLLIPLRWRIRQILLYKARILCSTKVS